MWGRWKEGGGEGGLAVGGEDGEGGVEGAGVEEEGDEVGRGEGLEVVAFLFVKGGLGAVVEGVRDQHEVGEGTYLNKAQSLRTDFPL